MGERVVVVGCGGVGGILAARLSRAGVEVTPITGNAEIAEKLCRDGYEVRELDGSRWRTPAGPARVSSNELPEGARFDLAILATKSTTLSSALRGIAPHLAPGAAVLCCQNGLPEELAMDVVGPGRVLGAVVVFGATMLEPGVYEQTSRGVLQIGRPSEASPDATAAARLMSRAAPAEVVADLAGVRWSKLAINCATSTLGAVGGERLGSLLRRRFVRRLVLEIWTELVAVSRAAKVRLAPAGGTLDIEKMALTPAERASALGSPALALKHSILLAVGVKFRRMRSSMLVALERGRVPEIDFLNGEVARRGAALGVPTPINARLVEVVHDLAARRATPSLELLRGVYDAFVTAGPAQASA